jgi:hypothetical protein
MPKKNFLELCQKTLAHGPTPMTRPLRSFSVLAALSNRIRLAACGCFSQIADQLAHPQSAARGLSQSPANLYLGFRRHQNFCDDEHSVAVYASVKTIPNKHAVACSSARALFPSCWAGRGRA